MNCITYKPLSENSMECLINRLEEEDFFLMSDLSI